ncbi:hypothetical protein BGY98DRAFT_934184 [Russula aff. rugulosa BPL654]|nr:hypothetical protein BGY98DRAFT_934184 [Russula aff. rugulosa BPL654]
MPSSFFDPTEIFWAMTCSSAEGLRADDPCINPALHCVRVPTGDPTLETTVARGQLPVGPQPQLLTYEDPSRPHGTGLGGHVTIQRAHWQDRCGRNKNRKVRAVCTNCNKVFGRAQELARHRKDVHEPPRNCLFCGFKWTRPSNIKTHLFAKHSEKFTAEHLVTIQALHGRMIVAFLDAYN